MGKLEHEIARTLNAFCKDEESDTPDWILAQYLLKCLEAWRYATVQRDAWFDFRPWKKDKTQQAMLNVKKCFVEIACPYGRLQKLWMTPFPSEESLR